MKSVAMFGYLRDGVGKSNSNSLRNEGKVPCVLYGQGEPVHFSMYAQDFKPLVYTPNTYTVKLDIDGKIHRVVLKDIQFHPVNDSIVHADFYEYSEDKPLVMDIPVKITGNSPGVRAGGKLIVKAKKLKVKTMPAQMPDFIEVSIDELNIGQSVKVGDLKLSNLTLLDSPNNPVVSVKTTRAAASAATEASADAKKK